MEDSGRHKFDAEVNARRVRRVVAENPSAEEEVRSDELRAGDVVRIQEDESAPADVLLLGVPASDKTESSSAPAECWVDTASLDGETRLKVRRAVFGGDFRDTVSSFSCKAVCEAPSPWLERFKGKISSSNGGRASATIGLERENLFVRGAILRNTPSVYGLVLYTGPRTKLHLNQQVVRAKFSQVERRLNRYLASIFAFQAVVCALLSFATLAWDDDLSSQIPLPDFSSDVVTWLYSFTSWFILFSYMVPLSLYVVLELGRFASGVYIQWDATLAQAADSDLSPMAISSSA